LEKGQALQLQYCKSTMAGQNSGRRVLAGAYPLDGKIPAAASNF